MKIDKARFRNSNNVNFTRELFYETALNKDNVVYTLKNSDHLGFPSLYTLYMETNDPTEYKFAVDHLDGWDHWKALCSASWFQPYIAKWREELEIRFRSNALAEILQNAQKGGREAFQAAKYIASGEYLTKTETKRGRPSKAEIDSTAKQIVEDRRRLEEDFQRIQ